MTDLVVRYRGTPAVSRVRIERGGLARLGSFVRATTAARRVAVVSDTRVAALYGAHALRSLRRAGIAAALLRVPAGERSKSALRLGVLWDALAAAELSRDDVLVALGGGVVGDLAGFAAASFLRGARWVLTPRVGDRKSVG